jgi:hypothetical protein
LVLSTGTPLDNGSSTSVGTTVYYYMPDANMFSLFANDTVYPIVSNRAWYRFSKVAPLNQPVRAITSEPILIEQPLSTTVEPSQRMIQIASQIRYATYRSVNTSITSDYQIFPIRDLDDFSSL